MQKRKDDEKAYDDQLRELKETRRKSLDSQAPGRIYTQNHDHEIRNDLIKAINEKFLGGLAKQITMKSSENSLARTFSPRLLE